jgi:hypothetical protein
MLPPPARLGVEREKVLSGMPVKLVVDIRLERALSRWPSKVSALAGGGRSRDLLGGRSSPSKGFLILVAGGVGGGEPVMFQETRRAVDG